MLVEGLGVGILPEPWARALAAEGRLVLPAARPALAGLPWLCIGAATTPAR